jgi:hypothetical protein
MGKMVDYQELGQVEDDAASEDEKHEALTPSFLQRHLSAQLLVVLHVTLFGIYALSTLYILKRQPSDRACDYKHSTHCQ